MAIDNKVLGIIENLTRGTTGLTNRRVVLLEFARINGWRPSDTEDYPLVSDLANAHLVVEHGLDNSIVISFLKSGTPYSHLERSDKLRLLALSYNNLVDWHFFPDSEGVQWAFNRTNPPSEGRLSVYDDPESWTAKAFEKIVGRRPSPNVKALDDALITTISEWRRKLAQELQSERKTESLSLLFSAILFARALEDAGRLQGQQTPTDLLTDLLALPGSGTFSSCIEAALSKFELHEYPVTVLGEQRLLKTFDMLNRQTLYSLFSDFYRNQSYSPYRYDFSVMSKHALSRIYENYVSLLREKEPSPQMRFFPDLPDEVRNKALGGIYTPQYIARFFAKFLKENYTPPRFRSLRVADPACGSGIFPRTLLELQCDPIQDIDVKQTASSAFGNVLCIDVDPNACQATRLSLALLHLVLTGQVPKNLDVVEKETIRYYTAHKNSLAGKFDAVMANPPYVKWERLDSELRTRFKTFLGALGGGRTDAYQAHLEVGLQMVKPGGYVLYVLPHAFLMSNNSATLRKRISDHYWVRVIADLSEIPVFDVGSYVILLVLQRRVADAKETPRATVVKCKEFVGHALQDVIENRLVEDEFYSVYQVPQDAFRHAEWTILPPKEFSISSKVSKKSPLHKFLETAEGFITGADDVFIRIRSDVPNDEARIYKPYLPDREMARYAVPKGLKKVVFYPYVDGKKLAVDQLESEFPRTWHYLMSKKRELSRRGSVSTSNPWWCPVRPRSPKTMLRHKIVSPHLVAKPRFALDLTGDILVSRSPLMYAKSVDNEDADLRYFLAVMNSRVFFWQMMNLSHKYARGYLMLEKKTLDPLLVPDPSDVPTSRMAELLQLVDERLGGALGVEDDIDKIVSELYGLTVPEMKALNFW